LTKKNLAGAIVKLRQEEKQMNQRNNIVSEPETKNNSLKEKLQQWEANPVGKCATCAHGAALTKDKYGEESRVNCASRDRAIMLDFGDFGRSYRDQHDTQGFVSIYRIEHLGRFSCQCWQHK